MLLFRPTRGFFFRFDSGEREREIERERERERIVLKGMGLENKQVHLFLI
jgi:hypothetical protein